MTNSRVAFSMIELIFVIVVIGILAGIAIPKLASSRNDAKIIKARTTLKKTCLLLAFVRAMSFIEPQSIF